MRRKLISVVCVAGAVIGGTSAVTQAAPQKASSQSATRVASAEVRIVGRVTDKGAHTITVRNGARVLTFRVPSNISVAGIKVGNRVEAQGRRVNGVLRLTSIHREDNGGGGGGGGNSGGSDDNGGSSDG